VLGAISEDYSNVGIILESVNDMDSSYSPEAWPARKAVPVDRREVVHALEELTREGYAQAYRLETGEARPARFSAEAIRELWFCATPKGTGAIQQLLDRADRTSTKT